MAAMTDDLAELARAAGVEDAWVDADGYRHQADAGSVRAILRSIGLPCDSPSQLLRSSARLAERRRLPPAMLTTWVGSPTRLSFALPNQASFRLTYEDGAVVEGKVFDGDGGQWLPPVLHAGYHRLEIAGAQMALAVAPLRACSVADVMPTGRRPWGISLRNAETKAGAVDFLHLLELVRSAASHGADAFCVGSLHGGSLGCERWLDPTRIAASSSFPLDFSKGEADSRVTKLKSIATLRDYYLSGLPRDELLLREFLRFDRDGGAALKSFALHQALREQLGNPLTWPAALRDPTPEFRALHARSHAESVGFQMFLQWLAERGLLALQAAARAAGMAIGVIADFTFNSCEDSSEVWVDRSLFLERLRCADADASTITATAVAFSPAVLAERGFQPFIDLLRANMAAVGGLRIRRFDRFWRTRLRKDDAAAEAGASLDYPFDDLLRLLVLESVRQRCVVVVEGADALPERLRTAVDQAGLLCSGSYRGLNPVSKGDDETARTMPGAVSSSDHGSPSLLDWWRGDDLQRRIDAGEFSTLIATRELALRERERGHLLAALGIERRRGKRTPLRERREPLRAIITSPLDPTARDRAFEASVLDTIIQRLGGLSSPLVLVDLDDLLGTAVSAELATLDHESASRLLDSTTARNRLNRIDDGRRFPLTSSADSAEQARFA